MESDGLPPENIFPHVWPGQSSPRGAGCPTAMQDVEGSADLCWRNPEIWKILKSRPNHLLPTITFLKNECKLWKIWISASFWFIFSFLPKKEKENLTGLTEMYNQKEHSWLWKWSVIMQAGNVWKSQNLSIILISAASQCKGPETARTSYHTQNFLPPVPGKMWSIFWGYL